MNESDRSDSGATAVTSQERGRTAKFSAGSPDGASTDAAALPESDAKQAITPAGARMVLTAQDVHKTYRKGKLAVPVLRGADVSVGNGELTTIIGQSGSGKSTLLHLLATLDVPDKGEIHFEENRIDRLPAAGRDLLRNRYFGIVFQFFHLLPELSVLENVLMPQMISHSVLSYTWQRRAFRKRALELIEMVGLGHRVGHRPKELSGGELQRASIARALIAKPKILFADEPTGNLDRKAGREVIELLHCLKEQESLTIVMVTHDIGIAREADRTFELVEGRVA